MKPAWACLTSNFIQSYRGVFDRFRPVRTYSDSEEDRWFSCCAFSVSDNATDGHTHSGVSRVLENLKYSRI